MPVYIKKVSSNVKKSGNHVLFPVTVISGKSGAGKSAIIQSIELALTGGCSDLIGPKVTRAKKALVLALGTGIRSEVTFSDGTWVAFGSDSDMSEGFLYGRLMAALESKEKLAKFLDQLLPKEELVIPESVKPFWRGSIEETRTAIRREILDCQGALRKANEAPKHAEIPEDHTELMEAVNHAASQLSNVTTARGRRKMTLDRIQRAKATIEEKRKYIALLTEQRGALEARIEEREEDIGTNSMFPMATLVLQKELIALQDEDGPCLLCARSWASDGPTPQTMREFFSGEIDELQHAANRDRDLREMKRRLESIIDTMDVAQQTLIDLSKDIERFTETLKEEQASDEVLATLESEVARTQQALADNDRKRLAYAMIEQSKKAAKKLAEDIEQAKEAEEAIKEMRADSLGSGMKDLEKLSSKYAGWPVSFDLTEGAILAKPDGIFTLALSGYQRVRTYVGVCCALSELAKLPDSLGYLPLVIPEERAISLECMMDWIAILNKTKAGERAQIIITRAVDGPLTVSAAGKQ